MTQWVIPPSRMSPAARPVSAGGTRPSHGLVIPDPSAHTAPHRWGHHFAPVSSRPRVL